MTPEEYPQADQAQQRRAFVGRRWKQIRDDQLASKLIANLRAVIREMFSDLPNVDELAKHPIFLLGASCSQSGSIDGALVVRRLKQNFRLVMMSEYATSLSSPCCGQRLSKVVVSKGTRALRHKRCDHCKKKDKNIFDRDYVGALNIFKLFAWMAVTHGEKPPSMRRPSRRDQLVHLRDLILARIDAQSRQARRTHTANAGTSSRFGVCAPR